MSESNYDLSKIEENIATAGGVSAAAATNAPAPKASFADLVAQRTQEYEAEAASHDKYAQYDDQTRSYLKEQDGIGASVKHLSRTVADGLTGGATSYIYDRFIATDQDKKELQAYDDTHYIDDAGEIMGTLAGAMVGGSLLRGTTAGASLLGKAAKLGKAATYATEAAVVTAPKAMVDSLEQNPAEAATNWVVGAALAGVGTAGIGKALEKGGGFVANTSKRSRDFMVAYEKQFIKNIDAVVNNKVETQQARTLLDTMGGSDKVTNWLAKNHPTFNNTDLTAIIPQLEQQITSLSEQAGVAAATGGAANINQELTMAMGVKSFINELGTLKDKTFGTAFIESVPQAISLFAKGSIASAFGVNPVMGALGMAALGGPGARRLIADNPILQQSARALLDTQLSQRFMNASVTTIKTTVDDAIQGLIKQAVEPVAVTTATSIMSDLGLDMDKDMGLQLLELSQADASKHPLVRATREDIDLPAAAKQEVKAQLERANKYLFDSYPKNTTPADPLLSDPSKPWKPTERELQPFIRKAEVVNNPLTVLSKLQQGSLTPDHMDALQTVWPTVHGAIRTQLTEALADPANQAQRDFIKYARRNQYELLMTGAAKRTSTAAPYSPLYTEPSASPARKTKETVKAARKTTLKEVIPETSLNRLRSS